MFKKIFCIFFVLLLLSYSFDAWAQTLSQAALSDASAGKNRLFETTLSVNTQVSAFVATLSFDENKLEFKKAKALREETEISINSNEKGKVTLAFLNKRGVKGDLLAFTFKSKSESAPINLSLNQAIDKNGADITFDIVKSAEVTVSTETSKSNKEVKTTTNTQTTKGEDKIISTKSEDSRNLTGLYIVIGAVVVVAVGVAGFMLGKKSQDKNKDRKN